MKNEFFTPIHINAIFHSYGNGEFATRCIILIFGEFDNYPRKIDNGMFGKNNDLCISKMITTMAKTLIAFYSRRGQNYVDGSIRNLAKGNNEVIVEKIKALLPDADVFQIDTVKKYSPDYMVCIDEAKDELRAKARPELTAKVENMDQYDTVILGYPNWWGLPPMAVFTFLESYNFAGKKIVPFCSHEGSGLGGSIRQIKMTVPDANLNAGVAIHGAAASHCDREVKLILEQAK